MFFNKRFIIILLLYQRDTRVDISDLSAWHTWWYLWFVFIYM